MVYKRKKTLADGTKVDLPFWWYRFKKNGMDYRVSTKQPSRRLALEMEAEHKRTITRDEAGLHDERKPPTLAQFETRFKEGLRCGTGTAKFYEEKFADLVAFQPLANARLDRIDEAMIERFIQYRRKQVAHPERESSTALVSPATVNRALTTLRRALKLAHEWRVINRVPKFRMLPGERMREFVLSRERELAYLAACPRALHDVALIILDTGMRLEEANQLQWQDVHLEPAKGGKFGYIQIRRGKTRNAKRVLSLTGRVNAMLRTRAKEAVSDQYVFANDATGKPYVGTSLDHMQSAVLKKLEWSDEFVIHSLRHTMLTRLGEAGADVFTIMKIAGHGSITISQRYVHPTPESLERAFEKLEAFNAETSGYTGGAPLVLTASASESKLLH
jgi:integrase